MKSFNGFEEAKKTAEYSGSTQLPVGAYVCTIKNVKYEEGTDGNSDRINILFDVAEGEQKGFFQSQYDNNISEDKKWKGRTAIYVPKDDGTEKDGWTKNSFARWINAFESSNSGYSWDWDENKWKNKLIGIVFGPTGTVIEGKEIIYTEAHGPASITAVREGSFYKKYLELKKKNGYTGTQKPSSTSSDGFMSIPDDSPEEIPF